MSSNLKKTEQNCEATKTATRQWRNILPFVPRRICGIFLLSKFQVKISLAVSKTHAKSALIFVTFYPNLQKTKQNDCGDFEIAKIDFT